jgi:RES domain-containing protein
MRLWRIAQRKYALDKLCAGTALYGGRWNPVGMPALYCGESVAITALEKLVHIGATPLPPLVLVAVDISDPALVYEPGSAALPHGWDELPMSAAAQSFGATWLTQGTELAMKIPSAIVQEDSNFVINPTHPDYAHVSLTIIRPFTFDVRLLS